LFSILGAVPSARRDCGAARWAIARTTLGDSL
jgi:hypothetical protein